MGCQIVRRNIAKLGDTGRQPFAIFDQDDTKNVMKLALKKHFSLRRGATSDASDASVTAAAADAQEAEDPAVGQTQLQEWVRTLCHAAQYLI